MFFHPLCQLSNLESFQDQPWSSQDVHQMRGRVHRQPQKHKVTCIHLLANDTSDIIVDGMARGKRDMMDVFLSKDAGKGMVFIYRLGIPS